VTSHRKAMKRKKPDYSSHMSYGTQVKGVVNKVKVWTRHHKPDGDDVLREGSQGMSLGITQDSSGFTHTDSQGFTHRIRGLARLQANHHIQGLARLH
ncbi:hypothetical protein Pcinc_018011, partial [Petrolisthes cinctipes]